MTDAESQLTFKQRHMSVVVARFGEDGWKVESVEGDYVTLKRPAGNLWFDAFLALITFGLWWVYVVYRAWKRVSDTLVLKVDDYGRVRVVSSDTW